MPARILTLFVLLSASVLTHQASAEQTKPNILFLLGDQWRSHALGYMGNKVVKTPHLDRLASQSVNFINAVSGCPVCCPMRASMLTGQRPLTHGVFMNDVSLDPKAPTIAKTLAQHGYDTGYIGKWHIDGHGRSIFIPRERRQGFEYWKVLECTHDYNNSFYYADGPEKLKWDGYDATAQTRDAQSYIRKHAGRKKPFALFLSWGPPHAPYQTAPEKYRQMYNPAKIPLRGNVTPYIREQARRDLAGYYAHCTALDDLVGDLRKTLKEARIDENTIIVFTSDHGDLIGSHGDWKKQQPYEESVRVPMLWHFPKGWGAKGRRVAAPINTEDLMPTLLSLAGVPIPKTVEGLDYAPYMKGGKDPSDGAALLTCPAPFGQWARRWGGREFRGIRTGQYTYVRDLRGPWLLFDNREDPFQLDNLLDQPEHKALAQRLDGLLNKKLKATGDEFLPGMAYIQRWGYPLDKTGTVPYSR